MSCPVLLIDWDWAEIDSEVQYPSNLNPEVDHPEGGVAEAYIVYAHEIGMVDLLT
jgi:hypothetical protein